MALLYGLLLATGLIAACAVYAISKLSQVGKRPADFPPGPPTIPVLGNLHLLPDWKSFKQFTVWGEMYGPLYSLMVGSNPLVLIQSHAIARELFDKRGSNYSTRPGFYVLSKLASREMRQVTMKYNATWRHVHRTNFRILNAKAVQAYTPYQTIESRQMLVDLLDGASEYRRHIQRYSNSITCQMVYGFRTTSWLDPELQSIIAAFWETCDIAISTPARLLDCYPILQKIPPVLLPVCRQAVDLDRRTFSLFNRRWLTAKEKALAGKAVPSYCASLTEAQKVENFTDEEASYIAGDLVEAASATSSDELIGFLMAMVTHPEVQKRAQEELDAVVGPDRLPTLDDMEALPYIRGCLRETLRWMPTTAMLVPHSPLKDDHYDGFRIPAGATVVLNVWALNMDPSVWPNPRVFDPTRFEHETRTELEIAKSSAPTNLRHNYVFGAGRRLCQGIPFAERNIFLAMACLLWAFDVSSPDPSRIDTEDLRGGLAVTPAPFDCRIVPRSEKRVEVMRREWKQQEEAYLDPQTKQWVNVPDDLPVSSYSTKDE
jgi:cytochrome P450